jgi:hypothetical protein
MAASIRTERIWNLPVDEFRQSLRAIIADPIRTCEYLLRVSMIASLRRAAELG